MKFVSSSQTVRAILVGIGVLIGVAGCSSGSSTPQNDNQIAASDPSGITNNLPGDANKPSDTNITDDIISTSTLPNSGLINTIPLLPVQATVVINTEFGAVSDTAMSPNGERFAIVILEWNFDDSPNPNPKGDRIEIYNTNSGALELTIPLIDLTLFSEFLFWSDSDVLHIFDFPYIDGNTRWLSWSADTGMLVQDQMLPHEPCTDRRMHFSSYHAKADVLVFRNTNEENTQTTLCQYKLSDLTRTSTTLNFPTNDGEAPIISADGSIVAVREGYVRMHTYHSSNLEYANVVYEGESIQILGADFRLIASSSRGIELLPSGTRWDIGRNKIFKAENGTVLGALMPSSRNYFRLVSVPDATVIGDVKTFGRILSSGLVSSDGQVLSMETTLTEPAKVSQFDFYSLTEKTNYTAVIE